MRVPTGIENNLASPSEGVNSDLSLDQAISEVLVLFPGSTVIVDAKVVDDGRSATDRLKDEVVYEDYLMWSNPHRLKRKYARRRGPCQE